MDWIVTNVHTGGSVDIEAPSMEEAATKAAAIIAVGRGNIEALPIEADWSSFQLRRLGTDNPWETFEVVKYPL